MIAALILLASLIPSDIWVSTEWNYKERLSPQIIRIDADYNRHVMPDNIDEYAKDAIVARNGTILTLGGAAFNSRKLEVWNNDSRTVATTADIAPFVREAHYLTDQKIVGYASYFKHQPSNQFFVIDMPGGTLSRLEEITTTSKMLVANGNIYFFGEAKINWFTSDFVRGISDRVELHGVVDAAYDGTFIWLLRNNVVECWRPVTPEPASWQLVTANAQILKPKSVLADLSGHLLINTERVTYAFNTGVLAGTMVWTDRNNIMNIQAKPVMLDSGKVAIPRLILNWVAGGENIYKSQLEIYPWPNGSTVQPERLIEFDRPITRIAK